MEAGLIDRRRYEQAAEWLLKVQADGASPEVFAEMLAWCDADPCNKLAMEKIEEAWTVSGDLVATRSQRLDDRNAFRSAGQVVLRLESALQAFTQWKRERFGRHGALLLSATFVALITSLGIAMLAAGVFIKRNEAVAMRIATAPSGHKAASLPDGSVVELGGKSSLSIVYSPQNRVVVAEDGESLYTVSKDASRPFVVRAGPVTVTAVGTAFAIRRTGESVSVVVTEGIVDVRVDRPSKALSVRATAGQRVRFDRGELSQSVDAIPLDTATAWREGQLQFVDEPLRLVIASVNRYYDKELLISDPALEELRFTGTVFEKHVDTWLLGLAAVFPVKVIDMDKRRVMITSSPKS